MAANAELSPVFDRSATKNTPLWSSLDPARSGSRPEKRNRIQRSFSCRSDGGSSRRARKEQVGMPQGGGSKHSNVLSGGSKSRQVLDQHTLQSSNRAVLNEQLAECGPLEIKSPVPIPKLRINYFFSLTMMTDMFMRFNSEKRALINSIGMGGLLKVHKQRLQCRNLLLSLLSNMDPDSGTITLKYGQITPKDRDVNLVLGIPYKGEEVDLLTRSPEAIDKVKAILLVDRDSDVSIEVVHEILVRDYGRKMSRQESDAFKVAAILYLDSCFLGTRGSKRKINEDIFQHVADPQDICKTNWAAYVLRVLRQAACKVQQNIIGPNKSVVLEGCLFFLLVFYLDNLNFGYMTPRHDTLPRIAMYTPSLVSELLSYDRVSNQGHQTMQFGRTKLRPDSDVVYTRYVSTEQNHQLSRRVQKERPITAGSTINLISSVTSSQEHMCQPKDEKHFTTFEAQEAFNEFIVVFRKQMKQCLDELYSKVHILLHNLEPHISFSSNAAKDTSDSLGDEQFPDGTPTNIGLKAAPRKYYMTVESSSNNSMNNHKTEGLRSIDMANSNKYSWKGPQQTSNRSHYRSPLFDVSVEGCRSEANLLFNSPSVFDSCAHDTETLHMFGPSPFLFELKHKDVPLKVIFELIRVLPRLTHDDKNMCWFIHDVPSNLTIGGQSLYLTFYGDRDFSHDIMDSVMRLYHELDNEMYQACSENRWRHFLPPKWAAEALTTHKSGVNKLLKPYFIEYHISYQVTNCTMIFVPVHIDDHWSLYSWDFSRKRITIMDPVCNHVDLLVAKHDSVVTHLHHAMLSCKREFLGCCGEQNENWDRSYLNDKDHSPSKSKSGLYSVFYARFFDGSVCTRGMLLEDSVTVFQTSLLCQLLGSIRNKGSYPNVIQVAMALAT